MMKTGIVSNSDLCLPLLLYLKDNNIEVSLFLAHSKENDTSRTYLIKLCKANSISITIEETDNGSLYEWLRSSEVKMVFIIGYKKKIKLEKISVIQYPIFNIHFGKLPEYRGPNPVFWQLKKGSPTVGLAIHKLVERIDAGPIVWQKEFTVEEHFNYSYVNYMLSNLLIEGVAQLMTTVLSGNSIESVEQVEAYASCHASPELKDVLIDWKNMAASEICNLIKACTSWNNGAITNFGLFELKILDAFIQGVGSKEPAGTILETGNALLIGCCDEKILNVTFLNVNGIMFPARFAGKYGLNKGQRLGV